MKQDGKLKVLSIDFDFFQNVSKPVLTQYYPDGIDLSTNLSKIVWGSKYSDGYPFADKIKSVKINRTLFAQMLTIINNQDIFIPCLIAQSHVHIYDFICKLMEEDPEQRLDIVNVDLHHDLFNDNKELDCGNWIGKLYETFENVHASWIARKVSDACYGIKPGELPIEHNFDKIMDAEFDAVFLCRSDAWVPPHLDDFFNEMVELCSSHFYCAKGEKCVLKPRDISDIIESENQAYEQLKDAYDRIRKDSQSC